MNKFNLSNELAKSISSLASDRNHKITVIAMARSEGKDGTDYSTIAGGYVGCDELLSTTCEFFKNLNNGSC